MWKTLFASLPAVLSVSLAVGQTGAHPSFEQLQEEARTRLVPAAADSSEAQWREVMAGFEEYRRAFATVRGCIDSASSRTSALECVSQVESAALNTYSSMNRYYDTIILRYETRVQEGESSLRFLQGRAQDLQAEREGLRSQRQSIEDHLGEVEVRIQQIQGIGLDEVARFQMLRTLGEQAYFLKATMESIEARLGLIDEGSETHRGTIQQEEELLRNFRRQILGTRLHKDRAATESFVVQNYIDALKTEVKLRFDYVEATEAPARAISLSDVARGATPEPGERDAELRRAAADALEQYEQCRREGRSANDCAIFISNRRAR